VVREALDVGNFGLLRGLVRQDMETLAEVLQEPDVLKEALKASENAVVKWPAAVFLFEILGCLSERQKWAAKATLVRLLMQLASQISAKGIRSTERALTEYRPGLEEVEVEYTLENRVGKKHLDYQDIVMVYKRQKKRGVALILDTSNSMQGEKILIAVLAIGVLAYRLQGENYAIISFNEDAEVLKPIEKEITIEDLLDKMLEIKAGGSTNIRDALEMGLEQLSKNVAHEKVAILATDGWVTSGGDPLEIAAKFPRLHVIQVPFGIGGDSEVCLKLAKEGRGKRLYVEELEELPRAVLEILG
jgi:hypothetical protein